MEELTLHVDGMVCGECESTVASAIRRVQGVKKAKASRRKHLAVVTYDPQQTNEAEIRAAVAATGYILADG
ncbi:MAG: heavy-metal-associated domain-containing protein [Oscillospiraceae bacterium]|nr:heavy-metal-associated domain-containing protein [Oscillospiraceae bacterium]MDD4369316.1 heavy-metal-associated domain-containing protein [Oscillospiraceae bacterium]